VGALAADDYPAHKSISVPSVARNHPKAVDRQIEIRRCANPSGSSTTQIILKPAT